MEILKKRVLVVDDMFTMRKTIAKSCKDMGFNDIIDADDGVTGWQQLNSSKIEIGLIISDWNMPNCSGIDFLRRVRRSQKYGNTPFVFLTTVCAVEKIKEAMKAGADGYIVKPFSQSIFENKIQELENKPRTNHLLIKA